MTSYVRLDPNKFIPNFQHVNVTMRGDCETTERDDNNDVCISNMSPSCRCFGFRPRGSGRHGACSDLPTAPRTSIFLSLIRLEKTNPKSFQTFVAKRINKYGNLTETEANVC